MASTVAGVLLTGVHASRPSSGVTAGTLYSCTTHGLVYQTSDTGTTWTTWATLGASTTMATDTLWDAAGDLAVGTGSNTGAKLTIGNAGAVLARTNGAVAWNAGSSFPTAATHDRYYRTDLDEEFFYDGTRWLSTAQYTIPIPVSDALNPLTATANGHRVGIPLRGTQIYVVSVQASFFVAGGTALSGSHKWVLDFKLSPSATVLKTYNIDSGASSTWRSSGVQSVGSTVATTEFDLDLLSTKTGTPGDLYLLAMINYRVVQT